MFKAHKEAIKALKRFHYLDHSLGPLMILTSVLGGSLPFIPIFLSKHIIEEVLVENYKLAGLYACILALAYGLLSIGYQALVKVTKDRNAGFSEKVLNTIYMKPLDIDYQSLEDGTMITGFNKALNALKFKGDYTKLINHYAGLIKELVSLGLALGLTLDICLKYTRGDEALLNFLTAPHVAFVSLIVIIVGLMILTARTVKWAHGRTNDYFKKNLDSEKKFAYLLRLFRDDDMVKTLQSYDAGDTIDGMFHDNTNQLKENFTIQGKYQAIGEVIKTLLSSMISVVSYMLVVLKILSGAIGIDGFVKYSQAIIKMNGSLLAIILHHHEIKDMMSYMDHLNEFLDHEHKFHTGSIPIEKRSDLHYLLRFENVWFKYPGCDDYVIKDLTCQLDTNSRAALVGPNGAGKTTFIKLLTRLYEPTKGKITLNGIDIRKYDYEEYQSIFSVVFQDFGLFSFSIGENVAAQVSYDKDQVQSVLERVGMGHYSDRLEDNLSQIDFMSKSFDEGIEKYSGGEQQKIAIARALHKDGAFVILDEPTAALDPMSEFEIYQNFDTLIGKKSCIYISHRMSSCRFCDDIIVLNEGQICERGPHDQLIEQGDLYHEMWQAQAKYYQVT